MTQFLYGLRKKSVRILQVILLVSLGLLLYRNVYDSRDSHDLVEESGSIPPVSETQRETQSLQDVWVSSVVSNKPRSSLGPFNDPLEQKLPRNRTVISFRELSQKTGRFSRLERIHFVGPYAQQQNLTIPEFPVLDHLPPIDNNIPMDQSTGQGHNLRLVTALDNQYSYAGRVWEAMQAISREYPHMTHARANAVIFMLCQNKDLSQVLRSLSTFEFAFNKYYKYPYVFMNDEPFTELFKERVRSVVSSNAEFGLITKEHWSLSPNVSPHLFEERLKANKDRYMYGGSKAYRFMCRYNSRFVYKEPLLAKYRYYWRVEPGIDYKCLVRYDPLLFMALAKKTYGYTLAAGEDLGTVEGLWKITADFLKEESLPLSPLLREGFYDPHNDNYNGVHYWSNFEIADLEFYRSELYESYMQKIEDSKGFFLERYGDAPIHSLAVAALSRPEMIHHFSDISYHHDNHGSCPLTQNATFAKDFESRCWCGRDGSWLENHLWTEQNVFAMHCLNKYSFENIDWL